MKGLLGQNVCALVNVADFAALQQNFDGFVSTLATGDVEGISTRLGVNPDKSNSTLSLSFGSAPCSRRYPTMSALFL